VGIEILGIEFLWILLTRESTKIILHIKILIFGGTYA